MLRTTRANGDKLLEAVFRSIRLWRPDIYGPEPQESVLLETLGSKIGNQMKPHRFNWFAMESHRIPRNSPSEFAWKNLRQRRFGMFETLQPIFACLPSFRVYRACSTESVFKIIDLFTNDPEPSFSVSLQPDTSICKQPSKMQEKRVERAVCVFGL